ncbi:MAG: hypothetical protein M1818_003590 [Claussenomyces sp. TS43310]|nr:MAG: hypothetical protein M1818_003590 [Claussenomyces sp. TS43310]
MEAPKTAPLAPTALQVRQRSRRACRPCQQRRRKCDGAEPCATCVGYGYECHYVPHEKKRPAKRRKSLRSSGNCTSDDEAPYVAGTEEHRRDLYQGSPATSQDVLDPIKGRFVGGHSYIVFPMSLGKELDSSNPPRLHSFAWNAGTRQETIHDSDSQICRLISLDEVQRLSTKFFAVVNPVLGFLDGAQLEEKYIKHWNGSPQGAAFESVIAGVCALASLFSGSACSTAETILVKFARKALDSVTSLSRDHVAAWILRSIYLRCTTRPQASWLAISTTMHIAEAIGLHREYNSMVITTSSSATLPLSKHEVGIRRRTFWIAWCLNNIFSCEYGRTPTHIKEINCREPETTKDDYTNQVIALVKLHATSEVNHPDPRSEKHKLLNALNELTLHHDEPELLTLLKVDTSFSVYRRLRLLEKELAKDQISKILSLGKASLAAARSLVAQEIVWWNVLGTPFQYLCILLAIDSLESLAIVPEAMQALEEITERLQTHMAQEALQTAHCLVQASYRKKQRQTELLAIPLGVVTPESSTALPPDADLMQSGEIQTDTALAQWFNDGNIDWDSILLDGARGAVPFEIGGGSFNA